MKTNSKPKPNSVGYYLRNLCYNNNNRFGLLRVAHLLVFETFQPREYCNIGGAQGETEASSCTIWSTISLINQTFLYVLFFLSDIFLVESLRHLGPAGFSKPKTPKSLFFMSCKSQKKTETRQKKHVHDKFIMAKKLIKIRRV